MPPLTTVGGRRARALINSVIKDMTYTVPVPLNKPKATALRDKPSPLQRRPPDDTTHSH